MLRLLIPILAKIKISTLSHFVIFSSAWLMLTIIKTFYMLFFKNNIFSIPWLKEGFKTIKSHSVDIIKISIHHHKHIEKKEE